MALLDLQAMDSPIIDMSDGGGHSGSSGHSCNASDLSVTLCDGHSQLSALLCNN